MSEKVGAGVEEDLMVGYRKKATYVSGNRSFQGEWILKTFPLLERSEKTKREEVEVAF